MTMQLEMFPTSDPMARRYGDDWKDRVESEAHSSTFTGFSAGVFLRKTPDNRWWFSWEFTRQGLTLLSGGDEHMVGPHDTRDDAVDAAAREVLLRVARRHRPQAMEVIAWLKAVRGRTFQK